MLTCSTVKFEVPGCKTVVMDLEKAARRLCLMRGLDPDKMVRAPDVLKMEWQVVQWKLMLDELYAHAQCVLALGLDPEFRFQRMD